MKNLRQRVANANALVVFESAARLNSFTRAAEELGISQPAVTRHVRAVETMAGRVLFQRAHNRLSLTPEGRRLWQSVSRGFADMAETLEALRSEQARRRLVLATHAGFAQQWLMPRFSDLCALLGDFDVRLMISDSDRDLDRGDFDLAVRVGAGRWAHQHAARLVPEIVFPVVSPGFLAARPELQAATPAALLAAPLLHMDEGDKPWLTWRDWFRAQGVGAAPPRPDVIYNNYPLVLQEALAGKGVALAWRPLTDAAVAQGGLIPVGPRVETAEMGYYLAWPDREPGRRLVPALKDWFAAKFRDSPA